MTPTLSTRISSLLSDPVADVLATQAAESARLLLAQGWDPAGDVYDIGAMPGDAEAAGDLLGRKLTREEERALELCIRAHLEAPRP